MAIRHAKQVAAAEDAPRRGLLTVAETAKLLHISARTLWTLMDTKKIPFLRLGKTTIRFDPAELDVWLDSQKVKPWPA